MPVGVYGNVWVDALLMINSILAISNEISVEEKVCMKRDRENVVGKKIGGTSYHHCVEVSGYVILFVVLFDLYKIPWIILVWSEVVDSEILRSILKIAAVEIADVAWS